MNSYLVICQETKECAIVDPGADSAKIINVSKGLILKFIFLTHGHEDHTGAVKDVKQKTNAPVCIHPEDASRFNIAPDIELGNGNEFCIGKYKIRTYHVPGHTDGQVCFDLLDGRIVVGDTLFVGGPGKTWSEEDFNTTMNNMENIVFKWSDETRFYPGHGPDGMIGKERPEYEKFLRMGWQKGLFGDVAW